MLGLLPMALSREIGSETQRPFAVVIIGGLGSIEGAAIGALIVGLARAAAVHMMPEVELFSIYLVMTAVLVFRPEGIFQAVKARLI